MGVNAAISFPVSTVGLVLHFVVTDAPISAGVMTGAPISNAVSANCIWINQGGKQRPLALGSPVSADFTYTVTINDSRSPHVEEGYLQVSFDTNVFYTSHFLMHVVPHF